MLIITITSLYNITIFSYAKGSCVQVLTAERLYEYIVIVDLHKLVN